MNPGHPHAIALIDRRAALRSGALGVGALLLAAFADTVTAFRNGDDRTRNPDPQTSHAQ